MTDQTASATEATDRMDLRRRIARAIHRYDNEHALSGNDIPSQHHHGEAGAVLAIVQPELDRMRERLRLVTDEKVAYVTGPTTDLLCEEISRLKAEVAAARKFAGEMRDFCSPHGVSVGYADRLLEVMDRAKEQGQKDLDGSPRGPVSAEYVRMKGQLEADLRKMTACAAQPPRPGAEKVRAMQGGIAAGICSSLAWAIQCFEGPAARGAFLKRVEGDR